MFGLRKNIQVLCIGSISLDIFFPTDEGIIIDTPEDITSKQKLAFELGGKILAPEIHTAVGGVAANVAQGLAKLGISSGSYGCIGKDANGEFCLEALRKNKVNTDHVKILKDSRTDLSAIVVLIQSGERTIIHNRDANKRLVIQAEDLTTPWVFVSALNGEWQKNMETIMHAYKDKKDTHFQLAFNPGQHNIKEDSGLVLQVVRNTDLLVLNKDEAIELMLHKYPECAPSVLEDEVALLKMLHQAGAKIVALTDGIRGAWVSNTTECWYLPSRKNIPVVDTTGAGDAFTSGFFGGLLLGRRIDDCLRFGMANGESVIQEYGGSEGLQTEDQIELEILHLIPQKLR